jgi:glycogen operon protein
LFFSQGVPMLLGGDEMGRTQRGNNNAYCQDNEISWFDWELTPEKKDLLAFVRRMSRIWQQHPVLQRRNFFQGRSIRGSGVKDVSWLMPSGQEMSDQDWAGFVRCFGMRLAGDLIDEVDEHGMRIQGATILVLFNAHHEEIPFTLPPTRRGQYWERVLDTALPNDLSSQAPSPYPVVGRSLAMFRTRAEAEPDSERISSRLASELMAGSRRFRPER